MARLLLCRMAHAPGECSIRHGHEARYNRRLPAATPAMEADRLNIIDNSLQDLALRSAELRRYL